MLCEVLPWRGLWNSMIPIENLYFRKPDCIVHCTCRSTCIISQPILKSTVPLTVKHTHNTKYHVLSNEGSENIVAFLSVCRFSFLSASIFFPTMKFVFQNWPVLLTKLTIQKITDLIKIDFKIWHLDRRKKERGGRL